MKGKKFWLSKTFWLNIVGIGAMVAQYFTGWVMPPNKQAMILSGLNIALRFITKEKIEWS